MLNDLLVWVGFDFSYNTTVAFHAIFHHQIYTYGLDSWFVHLAHYHIWWYKFTTKHKYQFILPVGIRWYHWFTYVYNNTSRRFYAFIYQVWSLQQSVTKIEIPSSFPKRFCRCSTHFGWFCFICLYIYILPNSQNLLCHVCITYLPIAVTRYIIIDSVCLLSVFALTQIRILIVVGLC